MRRIGFFCPECQQEKQSAMTFFSNPLWHRLSLVASLPAFTVSTSAQAPDTRGAPSVSRSGPIAIYDGVLNNNGLQKLDELLKAEAVRELHINSPGGEIEAGIKIGQLVFDKALDVVVTKGCFSSCANYVFTAAARKRILPGAIVVWHGSALQKNFREKHARIAEKIKTSGIEALSDFDRLYFERSQMLRSMQKDLFERIGVNEYVTRLGQEPFDYKAPWTISIQNMERFGIRNVEGPPSYGLPSYCSEWLLSNWPRVPVKCLDLTADMLELKK
jgi:hypothetical protein